MPKASELKKGMVVDIDGAPHMVKTVEAKSPSSRGAATLYKIRFNNLMTKQKLDGSYKGDDLFPNADCVRAEVQFSYMDGDNWVFMSTEDYSQYPMAEEDLADQKGYITENLEGIVGLIRDGHLLGIEVPVSVALEIAETAPGIKGSTATGRTKPATTTTGLEIQVPEYLEPGEIVKVNTQTGKFMSRA